MSTSSEKSPCTSKGKDAQKKSSKTRENEKKEAQRDERRNLPYDHAKKIRPSNFKHWPILSLLKPEFTMQIRMVMVYDYGGHKALIVTKDKNVYILDHNKDDHSNIGDTNIGFYPKKIQELCGKNIKTFACNSHFVLALTEEGKVYSWGFNKKRKLHSRSPVIASTPTRVAGLSEKFIVDIACGSDHSLALTRDGKVYAWGQNKYGQIGNGTCTYDDNRPRQVRYKLEGRKIVCIACGSYFNMVVTDGGKLYGWGDNERAQIDNTTPSSTYGNSVYDPYVIRYPREITAVSGKAIVKVACGSWHTLALTDEGKLYAWGKNDKGQVGVNNRLKTSAPVMVDVPEKVIDIAANDDLSVVVGSTKTVYVWGDCFYQNISTPFPTKFSSIHDAFGYSKWRHMHKPLNVSMDDYEYVEEKFNILKSLGAEFDDPSTSDLTIKVGGQPIYVHKGFLQIRCQHFNNKFQRDGTRQGASDPSASMYIVSEKFSYIVYKAFLKYLYTGKVDLPSENLLELMKLADEYSETNLKIECNQIIKQAITVSNIAFFYNKAIECNAKEIEEFCLKSALCHTTEVVLSEEFINLDKSIIIEFIQRASKNNAFRT